MDFAKMEEMVTPTTKMFTLCNPHNPVGKVFNIEVGATVGGLVNAWLSSVCDFVLLFFLFFVWAE